MEFLDYLRFAAALLVVLGLIGAGAFALRRVGLPRVSNAADRRLGVVEVVPVDARRQLALFRRDGVEHLVLLGPSSDLLIEGGIPAQEQAAKRPESATIVHWPRLSQVLRHLAEGRA
jgi:flagellar protein FliO/FliZ